MAAALAMDLRTRVMRDVDQGMAVAAAARKYSISSRTIFNWKRLQEERGTIKPRDGKPGPLPKLTEFREAILAAVRENSGITLEDLRNQLNLPGCLSTLWLALKRWGVVLKKSPACRRTAET